MIEWLAALTRRRDRHLQVLADPVLADVIVQGTRPKARFVLRVFLNAIRRDQSIIRHL